ncbi:lysophospholipase L1-like esterase [Paenibacillus phyllosphaerae]|uniref:Lysophospholipase L1-like esterase n=1 Tax=Paenibacillus phyllosphaerae TaxID=274593 RepID=A0A7W5AWT1_9BACL|nr:GDSL-type esterase/lipase family protein [Paenibacillus phyllosphaerae]MBB3110253.1 lysophospholipase L1-like esterase [Paenibacillus phyllosphaerae]
MTRRGKAIGWLMGAAAVSCIVWAGGLAWTMTDYFGDSPAVVAEKPPAEEEQPAAPIVADDGRLRIAALGDSLTRGAGDPEGKGYVGYMTDLLQDKLDDEIELTNMAVNGQISSELLTLLDQDSNAASQVKAADIIVLSIGGNDLFQGGQTLKRLDEANIETIELAYEQDLTTILTKLRSLNTTARIFLIGLYNPFMELEDHERTSEIVREWNFNAAEIAAAYPDTVMVPTYDLFQLQVLDYLARDLFHPNAEGYKLIGERVAALITE